MSLPSPSIHLPPKSGPAARRSAAVSWRRPASLLIAALLVHLPGFASEPGAEERRVCEEAVAYTFKVGKRRAKEREMEAQAQALTNLARRLWATTFGSGPDGKVDGAFPSLRVRYRLDELLSGGSYEAVGNKKEKTVYYCVPREAYREAQSEIRRQREAAVADLERRFAELESKIGQGELDAASTLLTTLEIDVVNEALETASYESSIDGRSRPFYVWLLEWDYVVTKAEDFVGYLTSRAEEMIDQGHLAEADRYLNEALESDRENARALQLRGFVQGLRIKQVALLNESEDLASRAWFDAAEQKLDEARDISADDPQLLEQTSRTIGDFRTAYLVNNPARAVLLYGAVGSLGADTSSIEDRIVEETGLEVDGSTPLSFGGGANFRVGRNLVLGVTGSWGIVEDENFSVGGAPLEIYDFYQLTGGVGLRTRRKSKNQLSFQLSGGAAWESVDVNSLLSETTKTSDSQTAFYMRISVDWKHVLFFVQQGLGFDDSHDSLVGWSNRLQFGTATVF